jgi:hypothetical protein
MGAIVFTTNNRFRLYGRGWAKLSKGTPAGFEKLLTQLRVPLPPI